MTATSSRVGPLREKTHLRRLWIAELGRYLARGLRRVALPWLVLTLTGSPLQLGLAFALETTPDIVAAPLVGRAIDRYPRPRVLVGAAVAAGFTLAAIPLSIWLVGPRVSIVYAALVALSVFDATYHNAREALLPDVVADANLDAANAAFHTASSAVGVAFLGVGGLLTSAVGPEPTVGLAALVTVASAPVVARIEEPADRAAVPIRATVRGVRGSRATTRGIGRTSRAIVQTSREWIGEYVRTVGKVVGTLRGTVASDVVVSGIVLNVVVAPYALVLATLAESQFEAAVAYGVMLAAVRVGSIAGNYLAVRLPGSRESRYVGGVVLTGLAALAVAGVGLTLDSLSLPVLGAGLVVALGGFGAAMPVFNVPSDSLVQLAADDGRGQVITVTNATLQLGFPVGYLGAGWLLSRVSPLAAFGLAGVVLLAIAVAVAVRLALHRTPTDPRTA